MKMIGRTPTGGVIVEAELFEYLTLIEAGRSLAILPEVDLPAEAASAQAGIAETAPVAVPAAKSRRVAPLPQQNAPTKGRAVRRTTATPESDKRICRICGKPMKGSLFGGRKTCPGKCLKLWKSRKALERYHRIHGVTNPVVRAPAPNPADPLLTNEQREQIKAERMAGIRARAP